jgi:hypothetical protein
MLLPKELCDLVSNSQIGESLFSVQIQEILADSVKKALDTVIAQCLKGPATITSNKLLAAQRKASLEAQRIQGLEFLPPRRLVLIDYRGLQVQMAVTSWQQEQHIRIGAAVRELAVQQKLVDLVFGEAFMVAPGFVSQYSGELAEEVVASCKEARRILNASFAKAEAVQRKSRDTEASAHVFL